MQRKCSVLQLVLANTYTWHTRREYNYTIHTATARVYRFEHDANKIVVLSLDDDPEFARLLRVRASRAAARPRPVGTTRWSKTRRTAAAIEPIEAAHWRPCGSSSVTSRSFHQDPQDPREHRRISAAGVARFECLLGEVARGLRLRQLDDRVPWPPGSGRARHFQQDCNRRATHA